ncbi:MAG: sigma-54 dependent transcriptional regulator [Myxococcota bacterium]|nr:sigma-54 dependent transcriptional regulator [Myxococcota bacterium]MDW8362193.1 sigma-54 dependent transcriptional regulator [Myxococcales bacterium]
MQLPDRPQILVADDEPNLRRVLRAQLVRDGYDVHVAEDGAQALGILREHHVDVVVTDLRMPRIDGMALLRTIVEEMPWIPVILITAHGTVDTAVEALKLGAFDYVTKPFDRDELRRVVAKAARTRELRATDVEPASTAAVPGRYGLVGRSPAMLEVFQIIERVADTPSTVLVTGESGTGKELIARALHEHSSRRDRPFVRVNCAAIPPELIESELFGYERGAFTGAVTSKPGRFELADTGTLFLDEIGEIPPSFQVKLLRALQEQEFERVGGIKTLRVDVRLVAATNRDLLADIAEGRFREDLYYRLHVVHLHVPPLRERREDIPPLVEHFLARFNAKLRKSVARVAPDALERLVHYPWRGNIRELENVMERCVLFCDGAEIRVEDLPAQVRQGDAHAPSSPPARPTDRVSPGGPTEPALESPAPAGLREAVREATARLERDLIARALQQTGGNVTHAARLLRISRKSLQTKMKELGLRERSDGG